MAASNWTRSTVKTPTHRIKFEPPTKIVPIRLLDGPQESLERFTTATTRWLDHASYTIGGGTTLEARWHHRNSLDVDLFVRASALEDTIRHDRQRLREALRSLTNRPGERFQIGHDFLSVTLSGAPVNMIVDREMTSTPFATEQVAPTGVRAQSTEEILAKKIHLRIIGDRTFQPRDFYDLAWCAQHDHKAWRRTTSAVTEQEWRNIRRALETMPSDWGLSDQALTTAADPMLVADLKGRSIALARDEAVNARPRTQEKPQDGWER